MFYRVRHMRFMYPFNLVVILSESSAAQLVCIAWYSRDNTVRLSVHLSQLCTVSLWKNVGSPFLFDTVAPLL